MPSPAHPTNPHHSSSPDQSAQGHAPFVASTYIARRIFSDGTSHHLEQMAPDLNTLPASPHASPSPRNQSPTNSRTMATSPHSLAATAAMNAGIHNEETRRPSSGSMRRDVERARRRSSIRMNLNLNDPAIPAPGEMQQSPSSRSRGPWPHSPHHERAPSLGELHQELEYEQEGQVVSFRPWTQ
jgi:hypothetical protein